MHKALLPYLITFLSILYATLAHGQSYLGAGNNEGITVTSSSAISGTEADNTINGSGLDGRLMEASRFLSQASFGARTEEMMRVVDLGIESWIDAQFQMPVNLLTPEMWSNWDRILEMRESLFNNYLADIIMYRQMAASAVDPDSIVPPLTQAEVNEEFEYYMEDVYGPYSLHFNNAWWHSILTQEDQLRQRVAFALSQIFVVSANSDLTDEAEALTYYYDILLQNAFGNFRELIEDITLSPAMGYYLSHLNNPKAVPEENIHPDENYAREIMQLFTIGLYELNPDGSRKLDSNGDFIPSYNNQDIKEMARVFTGLGPGALDQRMYEAGDIEWTDVPYFGLGLYAMNKQEPMVMYENWHDKESKSLLNGLEIPAGQSGMADINQALDFLFNHPNTGPFICRQLIQRLIKSNPTPDYISRVSSIFADNGNGVRGDMAAVIKAILLDEEARSCEAMMAWDNGKLSEPIIRQLNLTRLVELKPYMYYEEVTFDSYDSAGINRVLFEDYVDPETTPLDYWNNGFEVYDNLKQYALNAPTVFNFYLPDHQPVGALIDNDLYGPEYKIHDTSTAINYLNTVWHMVGNPWWNYIWYNWQERFTQFEPRYERYEELYREDLEKLIHQLDIEFTHGLMSEELKQTIRQFVADKPDWVEDFRITKFIIYLVMISPDYTVKK